MQRRMVKRLGPRLREKLLHEWSFWANKAQLPPDGEWRSWLIMGGRGSGKTRAGAEWLRAQAESGRRGRFALVGPTYGDVRDVMIEGESGLLAIAPRDQRPVFESSRGRLVWPNGAQAFAFSAESLEGLRGPQFHAAWCDEFCVWKNGETVLSTLDMALRLGDAPRVVITTTPRAIPAFRNLLARPDLALTHMATRENLANLAPGFWGAVSRTYGGTKLARQELDGELIEDDVDVLFARDLIEAQRIYPGQTPELRRIVVAVDPSVGAGGARNDECGIVVAGLGLDGRAYVLADWSLKASSPTIWAQKAMHAFQEFEADAIVAEANQGGEMVRVVLGREGPAAAVQLVHATRGKWLRAQPVALCYGRGEVSHVGAFPELEDQMCALGAEGARVGDDRLDALVWAITDLLVEKTPEPSVRRL